MSIANSCVKPAESHEEDLQVTFYFSMLLACYQ